MYGFKCSVCAACAAAEIKTSAEVRFCHFTTIKLDLNNSCEPITLYFKVGMCLLKQDVNSKGFVLDKVFYWRISSAVEKLCLTDWRLIIFRKLPFNDRGACLWLTSPLS